MTVNISNIFISMIYLFIELYVQKYEIQRDKLCKKGFFLKKGIFLLLFNSPVNSNISKFTSYKIIQAYV